MNVLSLSHRRAPPQGDSTADNPFRKWWDLGYRSIIPLIPAGALLSERSGLAKRLAKGRDDRGKAPGVRLADGTWMGFAEWQSHRTCESDLETWFGWGAGVGLADDGGLAILDIDASDPSTADAIERDAIAMLGPAPMRVGRWPRRALIWRTTEALSFRQITFAGPEGDERVELIARPKQLAVEGVHPKTGKPYEWPRPIVPHDDLSVVNADQIAAFFDGQARKLPRAEMRSAATATDRNGKDQGALKARKIDVIREAIASLPNTIGLFPGYDDMVRVGEAIHAATIEDLEAGREIFHEWASRWEGGDYDFDIADSRWATFQAPHSIGASWLIRQADMHAPEGRFADRYWCEPIPEETVSPSGSGELYRMLSLDELLALPDPEFLVGRHIPERSLGFLYGNSGVGKSFIALDLAMHVAYGLHDWHGDKIRQPAGAVVYLAGEGSAGYKLRAAAWQARRPLPIGRQADIRILPHALNFMQPDDVAKLARSIRAAIKGPVALVVVDTVSRMMPGADQNTQKEMSLFVKACDVIKEGFGCAVLGVHHPNKQGDFSGSFVLKASGDFVFKLTRENGAAVGYLTCEKMKDAPDGWRDAYHFDEVRLDGDRSSLVPTRCASITAEATELTSTIEAHILEAMRRAWNAGEPWGKTPRSPRYAPRLITEDFGVPHAAAEAILAQWEAAAVIKNATVSTKTKRKGFRVLIERPEECTEQTAENAGIFG